MADTDTDVEENVLWQYGVVALCCMIPLGTQSKIMRNPSQITFRLNFMVLPIFYESWCFYVSRRAYPKGLARNYLAKHTKAFNEDICEGKQWGSWKSEDFCVNCGKANRISWRYLARCYGAICEEWSNWHTSPTHFASDLWASLKKYGSVSTCVQHVLHMSWKFTSEIGTGNFEAPPGLEPSRGYGVRWWTWTMWIGKLERHGSFVFAPFFNSPSHVSIYRYIQLYAKQSQQSCRVWKTTIQNCNVPVAWMPGSKCNHRTHRSRVELIELPVHCSLGTPCVLVELIVHLVVVGTPNVVS